MSKKRSHRSSWPYVPPTLITSSAKSSDSDHILPMRSSMIVPTLDESLHSVGLSKSRCSRPASSFDKSNQSVGFDKIEIRNYERSIGDNPSCSGGPPVSIGWDYDPKSVTLPVEEYEKYRPPRRRGGEMMLPRFERHEIILDAGHTKRDIASAVRKTIKVKSQRSHTVANIGTFGRMEEVVESAGRKIKRFLFRKRRDKEEYWRWKMQMERATQVIKEENERALCNRKQLEEEPEKDIPTNKQDEPSNPKNLLRKTSYGIVIEEEEEEE